MSRRAEKPSQVEQVIRDLGDGLLLRRGASKDTEELAQFHGRIFGGGGVSQWNVDHIRDLMSGRHPTCTPRDFTIVEDTREGKIVSSVCLLSEEWSYDGVTFGVGRPEMVATHPDYRRHGLMRAQFDLLHAWSAERGDMLQAMPGIPNFYRRFGYEMAIVPEAGRYGPTCGVPALKEGEAEVCRARPAEEADLAFLAHTYARAQRRSLVSAVVSPARWRYYVFGRTAGEEFRIIEAPGGEPLGLLAHYPKDCYGGAVGVVLYELVPGANWLKVMPGVLRYLHSVGEEWLSFQLGSVHPAYDVMPDFLRPGGNEHSYDAFWVRVPDLPRLTGLLAPALERRLAASVAAGWSGELKLSFYGDGLRLAFARGRLTAAEPWTPAGFDDSVCFRDRTFLQLLFGTRSLGELHAAHPDCFAHDHDARVLLSVLFPKQPSALWAVV